jgi:putative DNA methylase
MPEDSRLIEHAFPLKQTSLDSVHEKNVRHGHISTLHMWPARRPLAACRAALIATLLPDPGSPEARQALCEKIGGRVVKKLERKKMPNGSTVEREKMVTEGGILHWHGDPKTDDERQVIQQQAKDIEWFRQEIRRAYGGRAPKVLDPFSGGGAIPLEAMRMGCEATAVDINPVAWFILKCTLEYPQKIAGQNRPLPAFILRDEAFMAEFFRKAKGMTKGQAAKAMERLGRKLKDGEQTNLDFGVAAGEIDGNLAWHVRAWGRWVLARARRKLAEHYPAYADFEPLKESGKPFERQQSQRIPANVDGVADVSVLNEEFSSDYLAVKGNPRWIAKPTVAYLWARTVTCKNCRVAIPLLKTRWLCKNDKSRVVLTIAPLPDGKGVRFGIDATVESKGGNAAQKREHDRRVGAGTMSRAGAKCPCCPSIMTMEDIRVEGKAGRLGRAMTAVVVDTPRGKTYRLPTPLELTVGHPDEAAVQSAFVEGGVPFGVPEESTPKGGGSGAGRAFSVQGYGLMRWRDLFTPRQMLALGTLVAHSRKAREEMACFHYPPEWIEALGAYLACGLDRLLDFANCGTQWKLDASTINHSFVRFALPITWDYAEGNLLGNCAGGYMICLDRIATALDTFCEWRIIAPPPKTVHQSSVQPAQGEYDLVLTDPPYYDAIPYSDLMDFFYVWLRRLVCGMDAEIDVAFREELSPKWDKDSNDGELIDDSSRHEGDAAKSKQVYEDGMARVFTQCAHVLKPDGRLVIVFANKQPDAWETLVSAIIRAGFAVDGTWPIQTEQTSRMRAIASAALASSVWLVCKKRPAAAVAGWDNRVLEEMRSKIGERLHEYWDAGIKGPDFIWAATGPALEAFSKHPVVKKANGPGTMSVTEFLSHVRRLVVDYVVGQVLSGKGEDAGASGSGVAADRLDEPTAYYLLHRNDFGLGDAPVGTVILYAVSCGLSDRALIDTWDLAVKVGGESGPADDAEDESDDDGDEPSEDDSGSTGSTIRLKRWSERTGRNSASIGYEAPGGRPVPLIDRVHRVMQLYKAGDIGKVDEYLDEHGLRRHELFKRVIQSLIEVSRRERGTVAGGRDDHGDETTILEALSNHIGAKGAKRQTGQRELSETTDNWTPTSASAE